jgi:hypothetical protein
VEATLRATVDPKAHVLIDCHFEYINHADFLANGYANAHSVSCPLKCRKGFKKKTVRGKAKCVEAKKRHRRAELKNKRAGWSPATGGALFMEAFSPSHLVGWTRPVRLCSDERRRRACPCEGGAAVWVEIRGLPKALSCQRIVCVECAFGPFPLFPRLTPSPARYNGAHGDCG